MNRPLEDGSRTGNNRLDLGWCVEFEPVHQPKTVTQRRRKTTRPRGGTNHGKFR